ncbi:hypothetical protein GCM10010210_17790 [Pseudonocardia hydrocarbonoxydans]|uniref:Uncharacterized protein n=1 Tax=Pseudonocardia hydrocarbonoxydans TaxID=76726 RepID=A0A4Y3WLK5_9PSEU|nr:hypothetical protein PHY01_11930 [Pseudonocardia hydrocarbonoxydans]
MILTGCSVTGAALPLVGCDVHGSDVVLTAAAHPVRAPPRREPASESTPCPPPPPLPRGPVRVLRPGARTAGSGTDDPAGQGRSAGPVVGHGRTASDRFRGHADGSPALG